MSTKQHTVRLPVALFERLEMRAVLMRRSINKEIEDLIQVALDHQADVDAKTSAAMKVKTV